MSSTSTTPPSSNGTLPAASQPRRLLAHPVHTLILLVVILGFSFLGSGPKASASRHARGRVIVYASTIAYEWAFVGYIVLGIRRRGVTLRQLIGGRWATIDRKSVV